MVTDDEIDELAVAIELQILENEEALEELPEFPIGKQARAANTVPPLEALVEE